MQYIRYCFTENLLKLFSSKPNYQYIHFMEHDNLGIEGTCVKMLIVLTLIYPAQDLIH